MEWLRKQWLWWFGHVIRRGEEVGIGRVMKMELPGMRKKGRAMKRWIDVIQEDMKMKGWLKKMAWD